jgi:cell wall-associated NlpC family hydrolase
MITNLELIAQARELVGVPWIHQGRTRLGVDCIGLVVLAAKNAGLDIFAAARVTPVRRYSREASPELCSLVDRCCEKIDSPIPGCIALFRFPRELYPKHFAIIAENGTMIHAEAKSRSRVIEHGYRSLWLKRTDGLYKLPGVRYE